MAIPATDGITKNKTFNMALYYLPLLIRSDRYFISRLEMNNLKKNSEEVDYNFVVYAEDRVMIPLLTIEDPDKVVMNQMAPDEMQDILLRECHLSLLKNEEGYELLIKKSDSMEVERFFDEDSGIKLDYSKTQKRITIGYYKNKVEQFPFNIYVTFIGR